MKTWPALPMPVASCAAIALLAAAALPGVAQQPGWHFSKEVVTGSLKREEIVAVPLDSEVYAGVRHGFPDLRVLDKEGREVPYLLERVTESRTISVPRTSPAQQVALQELPGGGLEITVAQDDKLPPPEGIRFRTPLTNYQQRVQVSGSDDGRSWQPLVADVLIFDYSRFMDVGNRDVALPGNRYRRLRIVVHEATADQQSQLLELTRRLTGGNETDRVEKTTIERRPFRIDRIEFWFQQTQERLKGDQKMTYLITEFQVDQNAAQHQTHIRVRTHSEPLTSLNVETSSRNFHRRASVQEKVVRGVRTEWREIGSATISRIDFRELHREELAIPVSETRQEEYRIVIDNRDNPPLEVTGVRAEGNTYRLLFFAAPEAGYRLAYGSETVPAPSYDTATLRESLDRGYQPTAARLSEQSARASVAEPPTVAIRNIANNPIVIGTVIGLLVVLLGWGLYRAGRRIDQLPTDSDGGTP